LRPAAVESSFRSRSEEINEKILKVTEESKQQMNVEQGWGTDHSHSLKHSNNKSSNERNKMFGLADALRVSAFAASREKREKA
jgi:hypothetical protein